jgi:hypothetical protein
MTTLEIVLIVVSSFMYIIGMFITWAFGFFYPEKTYEFFRWLLWPLTMWFSK